MQIYDIPIRLGLAIILGYVVGLERETHHRPAGIKTHIMVCMGAAVVSMIQIYMIQDAVSIVGLNPNMSEVIKTDVGRMGAQVISGIGFLGAGTILQKKDAVKGLTTAATLWFVACVGLAIGMGYYAIFIFSFIGAMLTLVVLRMLQKVVSKPNTLVLEVLFSDKKKGMDNIDSIFEKHDIFIRSIEFGEEASEEHTPSKANYSIVYTIAVPQKIQLTGILKELAREDTVIKVSEITE
jgi:putative Mg2+ transporter-C (MgtC) family protein